MNKQELIKKIAGDNADYELEVEMIVNLLDAEGWLRNPGVPIEAKDIRTGDRVRVEYSDGRVLEVTSSPNKTWHSVVVAKYFLLNRPKPELPTEIGSVVKVGESFYTLDKSGNWRCGENTHSPEGFKSSGVEWEVVV